VAVVQVHHLVVLLIKLEAVVVIQFLVHEHPQEEEEVLVGIILAELQEVLGEVQLVIQVLLMLVQEIRLQ
jgi:hypothetical protein